MLRIAVVVATLVASMLVVSPGVAAEKAGLSLAAPVQVNPMLYKLTGRAPKAQGAVVLQRLVNGRWVKAARLQVDNGVYRAKVRSAAVVQRYRAVAGGLRSPVRRIPARPAPDYSNPPPAEFGPLELGPLELGPVVLGPVVLGPLQLPPLGLGTADACGAPLYAADGTRRACTFADDFDGSQLDRTKWVPQTNFISGDETGSYACYRDHPDNVSVSNGALQLTVRKEAAPVPCARKATPPSRFTSGGVMTYRLFSQRYGRFEARLKNTETNSRGLQETFWLWPDDRQDIPVTWPAAGEIDIVETYSIYPYHAIPFLHYTANDNGGTIPGLNTAWDCGAARGVWNIYALEWTPTRLEISVNGKTCLVNTSGDEAFQRKYIVAVTQGLGVLGNGYVDTTTMPATLSVDYVHVWE